MVRTSVVYLFSPKKNPTSLKGVWEAVTAGSATWTRQCHDAELPAEGTRDGAKGLHAKKNGSHPRAPPRAQPVCTPPKGKGKAEEKKERKWGFADGETEDAGPWLARNDPSRSANLHWLARGCGCGEPFCAPGHPHIEGWPEPKGRASWETALGHGRNSKIGEAAHPRALPGAALPAALAPPRALRGGASLHATPASSPRGSCDVKKTLAPSRAMGPRA